MSRPVGIPAEAVAFYAELEQHNTREWWAEHRDRYEELVREPLLALTDALADEFGRATLFRPYNDVRFRHDKSPLKTEQAAIVQVSEGMGYYLRVSAEGLTVGGGSMHHASDQVTRMRAAVDDEEAGQHLGSVVESLRHKGFQIGGEVLKTRAPAWLSTGAVVRHVRDDWRAVRPLQDWFAAHVGPSTIPMRQRRPGG
jgi:uncharacterized protein (TIGR02453 family)